uniref:Uncharacterized protein n=1 Tax=Glossina palpalis gambiensis TaxID=67801 RepID=A0A1B0BBU2_9MUSC
MSVVCSILYRITIIMQTGRHLIYVKLIRKFKDYVHLDQMMETSHIGSNSQQNEGIADEFNERHPVYASMATNNCYEEQKRFLTH